MQTEIWMGLILIGLALIFGWIWSIVKVDRQHAQSNEILSRTTDQQKKADEQLLRTDEQQQKAEKQQQWSDEQQQKAEE